MKKNFPLLIPILVLLAATSALAAEGTLAEALSFYKKGAYAQALDVLGSLKEDGLNAYWKGLCLARLQRFDAAASNFARADSLGFKADDLEYERGQALYASQQIRQAREAFRKSLTSGYKPGASQYYIGFTSQILEDLGAATAAYNALASLPANRDGDKVKQPALVQLAELQYSKSQTIKDSGARNQYLRADVLPKFLLAMNYEKDTNAYYQAEARVNELRQTVDTNVARFGNGVPIPAKLWVFKVTEEVRYDSNVVAEADQASTRVSNAASMVTKTGLFFKYEYVHGQNWSISPDATIDYTYHQNRDVGSVYANDQLSLTPVLRLRNEHRYSGKPAAFLFDIEYNNFSRDYTQTKTLSAYSHYFNFTVGERGRFLTEAGNFTIQANFKTLSHYDPNQSATDPGLSLIQNIPMGGRDNLALTLSTDYSSAASDTYSKFNQRFSASYALADLWWQLYATAGMDVTFSKLLNSTQDASRGLEVLLNPSLNLRKDFGTGVSLGLNFSYLKQNSKDTTSYAYSKSILGLSFSMIL